MDNLQWMEAWIADGKQDVSAALATMGSLKSEGSNVELISKMTDAGRTHSLCVPHSPLSVPACTPHVCVSNKKAHHVGPLSQSTSYDGSLSDMLLPYQYDRALDDWLSEQELLAHNENGIVCNDTFHINSGVVIRDQLQFADPTVSNCDEDAQVMRPLPPLTPAHTRRPPLRKGTPSYRQNHIHSERQRRQDMTSLFNRLKSVLPHNMPHDDLKGDRCTILEHVIEYVQELDKKVQALGKVKAELMQGEEEALITNHHLARQAALASAESVSVRSWGHVDIFITFNCPKQRGLWPNLLALLQDTLQLDVQNVALSSTPLLSVHSIYAKVMGDDNEEVCCKVKKILRDFVADQAYNNQITS